MSERLRDEVLRVSQNFFDLTEEEKRAYGGGKLFDPIRCGTSFNVNVDKTLFWRDYLKVHVHPHFHAPFKPRDFRYGKLILLLPLQVHIFIFSRGKCGVGASICRIQNYSLFNIHKLLIFTIPPIYISKDGSCQV